MFDKKYNFFTVLLCLAYLMIILINCLAILKDADLTTMSAKKVRQQIEEKLDVDLTER